MARTYAALRLSTASASWPSWCAGLSLALCSMSIRGRRRNYLQARLQARLRRHRVEAARLAVSFRALAVLGESQKPESASDEARGRRGLGPVTDASDCYQPDSGRANRH